MEEYRNKVLLSTAVVAATAVTVYLFRVRRKVGRVVMCPSAQSMEGKTVLVTGANCGLGLATTRELAKRKARVIMACRDTVKAESAVQDIRKTISDGELVLKHLDLASLKSVRDFCDEINREEEHIHVLLNNAGVFMGDIQRTEDGFEMNMGINHLGHFLLTDLLLDKLKKSVPSRVVVVSSQLYKYVDLNFEDLNWEKNTSFPRQQVGYGVSKLANVLFGRELAKRLDGTGVAVLCVTPGMVNTSIDRSLPGWMRFLAKPIKAIIAKNPEQGCQSILYATVAEEFSDVKDCPLVYDGKIQPWAEKALKYDDNDCKKLWEISEALVGMK